MLAPSGSPWGSMVPKLSNPLCRALGLTWRSTAALGKPVSSGWQGWPVEGMPRIVGTAPWIDSLQKKLCQMVRHGPKTIRSCLEQQTPSWRCVVFSPCHICKLQLPSFAEEPAPQIQGSAAGDQGALRQVRAETGCPWPGHCFAQLCGKATQASYRARVVWQFFCGPRPEGAT